MSKPAVGAFRRTPTAGSISSLRDIKEDNAAVGDLQKKASVIWCHHKMHSDLSLARRSTESGSIEYRASGGSSE